MKKVILMLAVAAMASCSKSEVETRPATAGDVEIQAMSKVLPTTKAPYTDKLDTNGQTLEAYVIASKNQTDYVIADAAGTPGKWYADKMTFGSGYNVTATTGSVSDPVGFATPYYYPADDTKLYMVGLVPSDNTKWNISGTATTGVITIDGCTDIMAAAVTKNSAGNDIKKSEAIAGNHPSFTFKHLLTKLDIYVKADAQAVASFGKITKLELKDAKNQCTVTLDGAVADVTSSASAFADVTGNTTCPFYLYDYDATTPDYTEDAVGTGKEIDLNDIVTNQSGEAFAAYAMVNPVYIKMSNSSNPYVLHIETEKGYTQDVDVKLFQSNNTDAFEESTQGKQFKVTLEFKATEIKASATVKPWDTDGVGDTTVPVE